MTSQTLSSFQATKTGVSPLKPTINLILLSSVTDYATYFQPATTYILPPPNFGGTFPALTSTTVVNGALTAPTLAGAAATGTGVTPAAGGATPTGTGLNNATGVYSMPLMEAVQPNSAFQFEVVTIFPTAGEATGATAVLVSGNGGTPAWAGMSVPVNGLFSIPVSQISDGDQILVQVTPGAPGTAADAGESNTVEFTYGATAAHLTNTTNNLGIADVSSPSLQAGIALGTNIYIACNDTSTNPKLYRIDTTTDTVTSVLNNRGVSQSDATSLLGAANNYVYFSNFIVASAFSKLYCADNTGTVLQVSNTHPSGSDTPNNVGWDPTIQQIVSIVFDDCLYLTMLNSNGVNKLFKVDASNTVTQVSNLANSQTTSDSITQAMLFNSAMYFVGGSGSNSKVYKLDTSGNITQISNTFNGGNDSPSLLGVFNGELYFRATYSGGAVKLFKVTTADNVVQVSNTRNNNATSDGIGFGAGIAHSRFYFTATNSNGFNKMFCLDTSGNITQLIDFRGDNAAESFAQFFQTLSDGNLYFAANDYRTNAHIFKIDSSNNVYQVSASRLGGNENILSLNGWLTELVGKGIYYVAQPASSGAHLYKLTPSGVTYQMTNWSDSITDVVSSASLTAIPMGTTDLYFLASASGAGGAYKWFKLTEK